jgi:steroid 5-alpha reductase family enzyme
LAYLLALASAGASWWALPAGWAPWAGDPLGSVWWRVVVADLVATLVVFGFSRAFDNSSFYDPYWSVAPMAMAAAWWAAGHAGGANGERAALSLGLCLAWGLRLTFNWLRRWRGLDDEDWRYADFRPKAGAAYWWLSFAGFHLFPTVVVLLGCMPLYLALTSGTPLGVLDALGAVMTAAGIIIEAIADNQLHRFLQRRHDDSRVLDSGLWAYSRHPNYFGEVLFWWGLALLGLAAAPGRWWLMLGAAGVTLMILVVSMPMIDQRALRKRPHYAEQMSRVAGLFPWFRRS